jgi:hypothetical protein
LETHHKHLGSEIHWSSLFLSEEGKVEKLGIALGEQLRPISWCFCGISYSREEIGMSRN